MTSCAYWVEKPVNEFKGKLSDKIGEFYQFCVDRHILLLFLLSENWIEFEILKTIYGIRCLQSEQSCMQNLG